jgi:hypothetical protein
MRRRRGYRLAQTAHERMAHERMVHGEREGCSAEEASASVDHVPNFSRSGNSGALVDQPLHEARHHDAVCELVDGHEVHTPRTVLQILEILRSRVVDHVELMVPMRLPACDVVEYLGAVRSRFDLHEGAHGR